MKSWKINLRFVFLVGVLTALAGLAVYYMLEISNKNQNTATNISESAPFVEEIPLPSGLPNDFSTMDLKTQTQTMSDLLDLPLIPVSGQEGTAWDWDSKGVETVEVACPQWVFCQLHLEDGRIIYFRGDGEATFVAYAGTFRIPPPSDRLPENTNIPGIFDAEADVLDQPSESFSLEVWELVKDYWTDEMPVQHPTYPFDAALMLGESAYLQWNAWACPNAYGARYRLEKFVNAAESSGASIRFGNVRFITSDNQGYRDLPGCIGLYVLEEDYTSFSEALTDYVCSTNHTPFEVGQALYVGPWLRSIYIKAAESEEENLKYYEENDIYVPEDYLHHYQMVAEVVDQVVEITKICESDVYIRFTNGYERDLPWEWLVREDPLN